MHVLFNLKKRWTYPTEGVRAAKYGSGTPIVLVLDSKLGVCQYQELGQYYEARITVKLEDV